MPVLHASIHDVSPAWEAEIEHALGLCHEAGARPALLVVPNFHGRAPLEAYPRFCGRLRDLQRDGHEVYLHGFFHRARARDAPASGTGRPGGLRWLFAQKVVSAGEAEFSDMTREEACTRLAEGEQALSRAGLRIDGFVPPAWSMPGWLLPLLASRGYRYTEDHLTVFDPARQEARRSLVLNFASRTPARLASSVAFCRLARPLSRLVPTRIALHPGDMRSALLRAEASGLLSWGRGRYVDRASALFSSPASR